MNKYYTGVGSRETPEWACKLIVDTAKRLGEQGYILRSGGEDGADSAFEHGAQLSKLEYAGLESSKMEIFLPWNDFNKRMHDGEFFFTLDSLGLMDKAMDMASTIHPAWNKVSVGAKKLHARNCHQVLGRDLNTPSAFIIYYAVQNKQGEVTGGTRTAVELARRYKIKEYNLFTYSGIKGVINDFWN